MYNFCFQSQLWTNVCWSITFNVTKCEKVQRPFVKLFFFILVSFLCRNSIFSTVKSKVFPLTPQSDVIQTLLQNDYEPVHAVACHPFRLAAALGKQGGILKLWDYSRKEIIGNRVFEKEKHNVLFLTKKVNKSVFWNRHDKKHLPIVLAAV
ncbi:hypothetical protein GOODEAATRI_006498 [Goodea atripinnis]|uniref:Uncharacterized protein n=1 Tax=Goodea atripinnis TaxID=208336 RepID=A0ABV0PBW7_9TELE